MSAGGSGDDKRHVDPERPDPSIPPHGDVRPKDARKPSERVPPAGPHADPALTNPDATPGAGTLTPPGQHDDIDSTSG